MLLDRIVIYSNRMPKLIDCEQCLIRLLSLSTSSETKAKSPSFAYFVGREFLYTTSRMSAELNAEKPREKHAANVWSPVLPAATHYVSLMWRPVPNSFFHPQISGFPSRTLL